MENTFTRPPIRSYSMRKLVALLVILSVISSFAFNTNAFAQASQTAPVTVETVPGKSLKAIVEDKAERSWPWYVTRASGIVAGVSLIALLISGIGSVTGHFFRFLEPLTAWATHRAIGITFIISVFIHLIALLFDTFVPFNIIDLLVPWAAEYKPVTIAGVHLGSTYVALGVLALYGSVIVVATSLLWVDKKPHVWKLLHYISYAILVAVFVHALFLGTDTGRGLGRLLWVGSGVVVSIAIIVRIRRARSL